MEASINTWLSTRNAAGNYAYIDDATIESVKGMIEGAGATSVAAAALTPGVDRYDGFTFQIDGADFRGSLIGLKGTNVAKRFQVISAS